jgi:aquaporin NIP
MDPARSLAPALVSGELHFLWIYLAAPVFGALLAILGCRCIQQEGCCTAASNPEGVPCKAS